MLVDVDAITRDVAQARAGLFIGRKGKVAAALAPIQPHRPGGPLTAENADEALARLTAARGFATQAADWTRSQTPLGVGPGWNPLEPGVIDELLARVRAADSYAAPLRDPGAWGQALRAVVGTQELTASHVDVDALAQAWAAFVASFALQPKDMQAWCDGSPIPEALLRHAADWRNDAADRLIGLQRWAAFRSALVPLAALGLDDTVAGLADGSMMPDVIEEALERGIAQASLTERLQASGLQPALARGYGPRSVPAGP